MKYYYDYVSVGGEKKIGIHDGKNYIKIISLGIKSNSIVYRVGVWKRKIAKRFKII